MFKIEQSLLLIICLLLTIGTVNAEEWKLVKQDDGIQVFTRSAPHSALKAFKGVVSIPARLTSIVATIDDTSVYTQLFYNTKSAKELKKVSDTESYRYFVTKLPWPAQSRDSIVHTVLKQNKQNKNIQITLNGAPKYIPLKPDLLRIKKMAGRWLLVPEKDSVKVVYEMSVDPGGNLPTWLVNNMSVDLPFITLKNLRNLVKQAKYQQAHRSFIFD